jgi:hypothetical protein
MIERAACSWLSEHPDTAQARRESRDTATWHDSHGDDLSKCDSWLCVCGHTDSRGGSWETTDEKGHRREPTAGWNGHIKCTNCGRVYNRDGIVISSPGAIV